MPLIRSLSGIRATTPEFLTEQLVRSHCLAFHAISPEGSFVIGRDGRESGLWMMEIAIETFLSMGRNVISVDLAPTPTIQLTTSELSAAGGLSITASHNPAEWNGMKFINDLGECLAESAVRELIEIADDQSRHPRSHSRGRLRPFDANQLHVENIESIQALNVDVLRVLELRKPRCVIDAVNCSGSIIIQDLLNSLGAIALPLYCEADGNFPHTPEPTAENLTDLMSAVTSLHADLGIAVDPDADRLVLIDENGSAIGEEKTISLCIWSLLENYSSMEENLNSNEGERWSEGLPNNNVVVNVSSSRMTEDLCKKFGATCHYSAVGEINVVSTMIEVGAVIGGEGSGGVILPESHYGRDSLVGIALVLALMARTEKTLSQLSSELPEYHMIKKKQSVASDIQAFLLHVESNLSAGKINRLDGVRADFEDGWVLVRSSNTEPIVRVVAEAKSLKRAEELIALALM